MTATDMFYGAKPEVFALARILRSKETDAEKRLWTVIQKNLLGFKFRRQHPISFFVADFYCHALRLIIEVDGDVHNEFEQALWDEGRTAEIETFGVKVIRFRNEEIYSDLQNVIKELEKEIAVRVEELKPPTP